MPISPAAVRAIQGPVEARRGGVDQALAVQARSYQVYGFIDFKNFGESTVDVTFPVWFVEQPFMSFGAELTGNSSTLDLAPGNYPQVNVMVRAWRTVTRYNATFYAGAQLILVVSGPMDMEGSAHWQCEGTGLTNPLLPDPQL